MTDRVDAQGVDLEIVSSQLAAAPAADAGSEPDLDGVAGIGADRANDGLGAGLIASALPEAVATWRGNSRERGGRTAILKRQEDVAGRLRSRRF